ncbi:MAG: 3',5'-cyclic-nucleotide phosphodiesterase [Desulfuromonadales bacterium]
MRLRVLGCSGAELPGFNTSSFLIDETLLIDAGAPCLVLTGDEQQAIRHIFITHTHLDHIKGIALLADNLSLTESGSGVEVVSLRENLEAMRAHLFNDILWPDFTRLPSVENPAIVFREISLLHATRFGDYSVTACRVNHVVPTAGYFVQRERCSLLFSGDTGPTDQLWNLANGVDALVVDVSFPNIQEALALSSGHLTARLLGRELRKVKVLPRRILVNHAKPQHLEIIRDELAELPYTGIVLLRDGDRFEF